MNSVFFKVLAFSLCLGQSAQDPDLWNRVYFLGSKWGHFYVADIMWSEPFYLIKASVKNTRVLGRS